MSSEFGWLCLLPPAITIALALTTKRVLSSLFAGVLAAHCVLSAPNVFVAPFRAIDQLFATATDLDNFILIAFSLMVGGLLQLIKAGRGFEAFAACVGRARRGGMRRTAFGLNWAIGAGMFLDVWSNVLVSGATTGPLFDRLSLSRLRLAYFIHTIAICIVSMAAVNGWGAFYMGLLNAQGIEHSFGFIVASIPYMVYQWASLALVVVVMASGLTIGPLGRHEATAARAHDGKAATRAIPGREEVEPRAVYMVLPLSALLVTLFVALYLTGQGDILKGDAGISIVYGLVVASAAAAGLLLWFKAMAPRAVEEQYVAGMAKFFDVGLLIVLALALGDLTRQLGTGPFVAAFIQASLPTFMLPALVFLLGAVMSFATGTSYGTYSIMVPIALPLATASGLDPHLMFGACIAGGLFGDNTSPISDTTIMTSLGADVPIVDHVATQLPYALISAVFSMLAFMILGAMA